MGRAVRRRLRPADGHAPDALRTPLANRSEPAQPLSSPDQCRAKVEELWDVADSFCLIPPLYALPPDKAMFYAAAFANTFYE